MAPWIYERQSVAPCRALISSNHCLFCSAALLELGLPDQRGGLRSGWEASDRVFRQCPVCGWWTARAGVSSWTCTASGGGDYGAVGCLRALDLADINVPLETARAYLAAKGDARFAIDPWRLEDVVASIFKDIGFKPRVTARSGDGGIDIVLDGVAGNTVGVQVKRYRGAISVEQIRSFCGALVIGGFTRGIFVTTSRFQKGVARTAALSTARGIPIELVDWQTLFAALKIAQLKVGRIDPERAKAISARGQLLRIREDEQ